MSLNWKKARRIILHIGFWLLYLMFYSILYGYRTNSITSLINQNLYTVWVDISLTYFTIYFLLPRFLLKRKYFLFFGLLVLSALVAGTITRMFNYYYVIPHFSPDYDLSNIPIFNYSIIYLSYNLLPVVLLVTAIKLLKFWIEERHRTLELEIQNQSSELALLRNQFNPHFLFNTLNNIHTLITKDSDKAADALMRLSDILRYMLYETNTELVPLEKEIEYIQSFIELQKLRLTNPKNVTFQLNSTINGYLIAPMLLIPFIENAFKHSEKGKISAPVSIKLEANAKTLIFELSNPIREKNEESLDTAGGIGLKNVKRRLELLYPNMHTLSISTNDNMFYVHLTLNV